MGNKGSQKIQVNDDNLQQSCQFLVKHQGSFFTKQEVLTPIKIILQSLRQKQPIQLIAQKIYVHPSFVKFIFKPNFSQQILKLVQLFMSLLQEINKKILNFLKIKQINDVTAIADFILYFTNEKVMQAFDSLLVRTDVAQATKQILKQIQKSQGPNAQLQVNGNLVQKMNEQQLQTVQKTLRITIMNFINLRLQTISRSQKDLRYFSFLQQSLFMLYTKLYFAHKRQKNIPSLNQHFKSNITIGSYFLSAGTSYILPSLYQTSVIFLYSFLKMQGVQHKQIKQLPSHLFKSLPVIATHSLYQYILSTLLFTLKYVKQGNQTYIRFSFNRIMTLKLVQLLLKNTKLKNKTITYYLEQLCLQVKVGQIQRACVYQIAQLYKKLQGPQSQIINKFLQTGNLKYNLKFTDRQIKISKQELLTELEDDQDTCKKEYYITSHKFVLERILFRNVVYNFNDRLLWNQILPNIMNSKEDQQVRVQSKSKLQEKQNGDDSDDNNSDKQNENKQVEIQAEKKQQIKAGDQSPLKSQQNSANKMQKQLQKQQ